MKGYHIRMPEELMDDCKKLAERFREDVLESRRQNITLRPSGPDNPVNEYIRRGLQHYNEQCDLAEKLL